MNPTLEIESKDHIPDGSSVRDYDELAHPAKTEFPELIAEDRVDVCDEVADCFDDGDVVRYMQYYHVNVAE